MLLKASVPKFIDRKNLEDEEGILEEHQSVLERFCRYPRRNSKLGREKKLAEHEWLNETEHLSNWAKSQG
jgi:uncharacterized protein (DUF924 family)